MKVRRQMQVKLNCGHTIEVDFQGSCPADCNGTFKCPECGNIECNCKPPKKKPENKRVAEKKKEPLVQNIFRWNGKYSNDKMFRKGSDWHDCATETYKVMNGYRMDEICVYCGRSRHHHFHNTIRNAFYCLYSLDVKR